MESSLSEKQKTQNAENHNFLYNSLISFLSKANLQTLSNEICKVFANILQTQEAALFLQEKSGYKIKGAFSLRKKRIQTTHLGLKSPFINRLKQIKASIIYKDQWDFSLEEFKILFLKKTLYRFSIDYIIPLWHRHKFIGFLILGKPKTSVQNSQELKQADISFNFKLTVNLAKHLTRQAVLCLDYVLMQERLAEREDQLIQIKQIKNYLWQYFNQGIMFINHPVEKITALNQKIKEIFKVEGFTPLNKHIDFLIKKYPTHILSDFLRCYKDAKILRRSFRKNLFNNQDLRLKKQKFVVNSIFIQGAGRRKVGDLLIVDTKEEKIKT